ncbi:hypothetical protein ACJMK2_023594 [Sinanodonta woodiana]|uniref:DZIP3-like HEPN domain-containing protein n=1 Tax=Sinanodonta woodiana TaxID=1069815 RepID=A0ABD3T5A7_SINWO
MSFFLARISDPQYNNWLKCFWALDCLTESLHNYTSPRVRRLFNNVEQNVKIVLGSRYQCNACSCNGIRQRNCTGDWSINCINCICNVWLQEILSQHDDPKSKTINWGNADITKWSTEPWEIAKIYMTNGQRNKTDLPKELDCAALLSLIKYCKEFRPVNVQLVSDVIQIRNQICHSPCMKLSDTDKDTGFDKILLLLSDLNIGGIFIPEITELKTKDIDEYYREKELQTHQNRVSEVLNDVKTLKSSIDSLRNDQAQPGVMPLNGVVHPTNRGSSRLKRSGGKFKSSLRGNATTATIQSKNEAGYLQSAAGWIHQSQEQHTKTDLRELRSELESYAQVISAMETFFDNNPDLSAGNILEDLMAASDAVKEMQSRLFTT